MLSCRGFGASSISSTSSSSSATLISTCVSGTTANFGFRPRTPDLADDVGADLTFDGGCTEELGAGCCCGCWASEVAFRGRPLGFFTGCSKDMDDSLSSIEVIEVFGVSRVEWIWIESRLDSSLRTSGLGSRSLLFFGLTGLSSEGLTRN
jgi:hypothetical protein